MKGDILNEIKSLCLSAFSDMKGEKLEYDRKVAQFALIRIIGICDGAELMEKKEE